jgi:hypothetical protein
MAIEVAKEAEEGYVEIKWYDFNCIEILIFYFFIFFKWLNVFLARIDVMFRISDMDLFKGVM